MNKERSPKRLGNFQLGWVWVAGDLHQDSCGQGRGTVQLPLRADLNMRTETVQLSEVDVMCSCPQRRSIPPGEGPQMAGNKGAILDKCSALYRTGFVLASPAPKPASVAYSNLSVYVRNASPNKRRADQERHCLASLLTDLRHPL